MAFYFQHMHTHIQAALGDFLSAPLLSQAQFSYIFKVVNCMLQALLFAHPTAIPLSSLLQEFDLFSCLLLCRVTQEKHPIPTLGASHDCLFRAALFLFPVVGLGMGISHSHEQRLREAVS